MRAGECGGEGGDLIGGLLLEGASCFAIGSGARLDMSFKIDDFRRNELKTRALPSFAGRVVSVLLSRIGPSDVVECFDNTYALAYGKK